MAPLTYAQPAARPFTDQYCVVCHNSKSSTAGVSLTGVSTTTPADPALLERVLRKVATGEMPPAGMPRPPAAVLDPFVKSLTAVLDGAATAHPNPGRPAVHRLNRAEYSNAIRDILAVDVQPGLTLPVDDSGYGFDNIGDVLSFSPALLERYMSVARRVSRLAVGNVKIKPGVDELSARHDAPGAVGKDRNERTSDDLPFDSRGGFSATYYFPVDAEYVLRVQTGQGAAAHPAAPLWRFARRFPPVCVRSASLSFANPRSPKSEFLRAPAPPRPPRLPVPCRVRPRHSWICAWMV